MDALNDVPLFIWLVIVGTPTIAFLHFYPPKKKPPRPRRKPQRYDPELMNMVLGDRQKHDRLVKYHGSADGAKAKLLQDRRSWR